MWDAYAAISELSSVPIEDNSGYKHASCVGCVRSSSLVFPLSIFIVLLGTLFSFCRSFAEVVLLPIVCID